MRYLPHIKNKWGTLHADLLVIITRGKNMNDTRHYDDALFFKEKLQNMTQGGFLKNIAVFLPFCLYNCRVNLNMIQTELSWVNKSVSKRIWRYNVSRNIISTIISNIQWTKIKVEAFWYWFYIFEVKKYR